MWGIQTPGRLISPHLDKAVGYKHNSKWLSPVYIQTFDNDNKLRHI